MKLVTYESARQPRVGTVEGDVIVDVRGVLSLLASRRVPRLVASRPVFRDAARVLGEGAAPRDMIELLARGEGWQAALGRVASALAGALDPRKAHKSLFTPLAKARLRAPVPRPGKICAIGLNYADHAREQGKEPPARPIMFLKGPNTIVGPGDAIQLPINSTQVDFEAELAVVIGKRAKRVSEEDAWNYVAGFTALTDVSARDMQYADRQWFRGKSCDTCGPMGPWIVTRDEISDPDNLRISLTLNGQTMQDSNTRELIFKIPFLISFLSQSMTWEPGDILMTGTPGGVGHYRQPPVYLKPGDIVSVTIEKVGTLTNPVIGP
jgi:2-keto-4-pentenoate hydratase/2-oxohepta-3-ene-1,7-dioic acid hydratase in catechol pathway